MSLIKQQPSSLPSLSPLPLPARQPHTIHKNVQFNNCQCIYFLTSEVIKTKLNELPATSKQNRSLLEDTTCTLKGGI
ncbi:hypothetical protein ACTXT7_013185 [Hymenolepis weldensis]